MRRRTSLREILGATARLSLPTAVLLCAVVGRPGSSPAATPRIAVTSEGAPEVAIPADAFNCPNPEGKDQPDEPVRMFRDASGSTHVIAGNHLNYAFMMGADSVIRPADCHQMLQSRHDPDPSAFEDREWIESPYTLDGTHVSALVHDEYWAWVHDPVRCPKRTVYALSCYYAAITLVQSQDGGWSFSNAGKPPALVASSPYPFNLDMKRVGIGNPSNIVRDVRSGTYYVFVEAFGYREQQSGTCILRSHDLLHWNFWNGSAFEGKFAFPSSAVANPVRYACTPVSQETILSVVFDDAAGVYVAAIERRRYRGGGVALAISDDLTHWSTPALVMLDPPQGLTFYPSLLEPEYTRAGRNFDHVDNNPTLYYVLLLGKARSVMRMRLTLAISASR